MDTTTSTIPDIKQNSTLLQDAYLDFILSRQAMLCTPRTMVFYQKNLGKIITWLLEHGVDCPEKITSNHIRTILNDMSNKGKSDSYIHIYARVFRTFTLFLLQEKYIYSKIEFSMPKLGKKRQLVLNQDQVLKLLKSCDNKRDEALILLLVDCGVRCAEMISLNWGDIDMTSGVIAVKQGKGRKARLVVIGSNTRRALLKYRRDIDYSDNKPVIQTREGGRFTYSGIQSMMIRISRKTGIRVTPHALRRTFATLSLRAGMNLCQLQGLMGHSTLEMTRRYVEMLDDDLKIAHKEHGPIDTWLSRY